MAHTKLTCEAALRAGPRGVVPCRGVLGFLWGSWRKVRKLERGQRAAEGRGRMDCARCGQAWEIEQVRDQQEAA